MRSGGAYIVNKPGDKPELVEQTLDHKDGNRPRDKDGKALNVTAEPVVQNNKPIATKKGDKK
ncbi:hypothetical protein JYT79_03580 [Cardiobacterium sp. AH-315-I02]|nr:hypothetical protein [Cardiobacterium sp. AH-315-I02]